MNEKYDVAVVGAGPAGSIAARAAARSGAKVLLLDKRHELGVPVQCGEALGEDVLRELRVKPDSRWAVHKVNVAKIVSPSGIAVYMSEKAAGGKIGYILDRKIFDKHLATLAADAGSDIRVGTVVDGLLSDGGKVRGVRARGPNGRTEVCADVIIAADGVMSRVARWAGINTVLKLDDLESGAQFQMVGIEFESPTTMEYYLSSKLAPGGYVWIFPKGKDMANVGLGVLASRAEHRPIDYLRNFVNSRPNLQKGRVIEINAGGVPVGGPVKETVRDGLIIVGDAARHVNPLTGGGIDYAMRAGDIAGEVAAKAVAEGNTSKKRLSEYQRRWMKLFGKRLGKYLKAKNVIINFSDAELDELAEAVQGVKFERISLSALLRVLIKSHPKLLWKLRGPM